MNIKNITFFLISFLLLVVSMASMAGSRGLLPLGRLQQGGFYSPGAPYFSRKGVKPEKSIVDKQKKMEKGAEQYIKQSNKSIGGGTGKNSAYAANGGDKLGKKLSQARNSIQSNGNIKMVPPTPAPVFQNVLEGKKVKLHQIHSP